jgi:hypothetical protein
MSLTTPCSRSRPPAERQQCSGSGLSRPTPELTVSAPIRSSKRPDNRGTNDRSQGTADIARRSRAAMKSREKQLKGHWRHPASRADRMPAGQGVQLALPTHRGPPSASIGCVVLFALPFGSGESNLRRHFEQCGGEMALAEPPTCSFAIHIQLAPRNRGGLRAFVGVVQELLRTSPLGRNRGFVKYWPCRSFHQRYRANTRQGWSFRRRQWRDRKGTCTWTNQ